MTSSPDSRLTSGTVPGPPDRRAGGDRRRGDRRTDRPGRRDPDFDVVRTTRRIDRVAIALSGAAVAIGLWATTHAPVATTPSLSCGDGLGGQVLRHRQLSLLWIPAAVVAVLGLAVPGRRRPTAVLVLTGLCVGLAVAAVLRIDSWVEGLCLA